MSPSASTSGWPRSVRSGSTAIRPARSSSAPVSSARRCASPDAVTPAAQMTVRASTRSLLASRARHGRRPARRRRRPCAGAWASRRGARATAPPARESEGGKLVSTRSAASTSSTRACARVDRAKVAAQRVARQLGDLAGHLDAGRAGADDDERQPGAAPRGVVVELGRLEGATAAVVEPRPRSRATSPPALRRASRRGRSTSSCEPPATISVSYASARATAISGDRRDLEARHRRGRSPRPPRAPPGRCDGAGRRRAAGSRSRRARAPRWPPGR